MTLSPYERAKQSILEEFEKFCSKIEPTENEKKSISISHTKMRTMLENSTDVKIVDTFLTGSYARDTMIRPLKDVDFIVQVRYGNHKNDTPMQLLNKVSRILRSAYPQTPIAITLPCITVKFSYCHFEVVPAIGFTDNEELFKIPTGNNQEPPTRHSLASELSRTLIFLAGSNANEPERETLESLKS